MEVSTLIGPGWVQGRLQSVGLGVGEGPAGGIAGQSQGRRKAASGCSSELGWGKGRGEK